MPSFDAVRAEHASSSARASVAEIVLRHLKHEGIKAIFGIPGGPVTPLFDALYHEPAVRTVAARHEAGAAFMALGYARASGRLGACCLTTGPGATNAVTAVAAAKTDGLPLLVLTAQVATTVFGRGSLQDSSESGVDTVQIFRPVTKMSATVSSAENAGHMLRQAIRTAMTGRRGPVHLSIPTDLMRRLAPGETPLPQEYRPLSRLVDREAAAECASRLSAARRPAILAGHGVNLSGAHLELLELANRLAIPVATTPKGKGAFPETHPLALRVFGLASSPLAESYLLSPDVDVLLVVGSSLHENATQGWDQRLGDGRALLHQDIEPATIGRNYPVSLALPGDAKSTLREVLSRLGRGIDSRPTARRRAEYVAWQEGVPRYLDPDAMLSRSVPVKPQRLMRELDLAFPADALVFLDVGNHTLWATHYLTANGRNAFAHNWGEFAAMGYGVAAPIGAKLAAPARPVVAVVGDGGFAMAGMEVSAAVTDDVPVVWVVLNDARLNAVHQGQTAQYAGRTIGTEFHRMDIAGVASALGAWSRRVDRPEDVGRAVRDAIASRRPAVIDVLIDADEPSPLQSRIRSLDRLFQGESQ